MNELGRSEGEERSRATQAQQIQGSGPCRSDMRRAGAQVSAGQELGLDDPPLEVAPGWGQPSPPPVVLTRPVDGVEVVS